MCRFYIPSCDPENWKSLLADPEKHWRTGYSAKALAYSWTEADDFPPEVKKAFRDCDESELRGIELLMGFPEYQVPLPGGSRPSQNDLFLLAKAKDGLVSITVEGKVSEPFGETVADWLKDASEGKKQRLECLCDTLGLDIKHVMGLRYQLLHRTASALIEAARFNAKYAVMLVHSFSQTHEGFEDFKNFTALYGCNAEMGKIHYLKTINGIQLKVGWITGDNKFLNM